MDLIYDGKTKQILKEEQHLVMRFKDTILGDSSGSVDPGGNQIVGKKENKGEASARASAHFFNLLEKNNVSTHFLGVKSPREIKIKPTERHDLEVIYREKAHGSFLSRYGDYTEQFQKLELIEFSLKDDELGDPFISEATIPKLNLAESEVLQDMRAITREVASIIGKELSENGLELIDMKLEFGEKENELLVIDEISGDTMRTYDPIQEKILNQIELSENLNLI